MGLVKKEKIKINLKTGKEGIEPPFWSLKLHILPLNYFPQNLNYRIIYTLYRNPTYITDVKSRCPSTRRRELNTSLKKVKFSGWKDSNLWSSASKAGTLNQLSYTPFNNWFIIYFFFMKIPAIGLEPILLKELNFKSSASTISPSRR